MDPWGKGALGSRSFSWTDGTEVTGNWDPTANSFKGGWRTEHSYVISDPDGIIVTSEDHMCTFQQRNRVTFV